MGQTPTDEELFQMINDVDDNASGSIGTFYFSNIFLSLSVHTFSLSLADFTEFLKVVEKQKERTAKFDDESDIRTFYFLHDPHTSHMLTIYISNSRRIRGLWRKFWQIR